MSRRTAILIVALCAAFAALAVAVVVRSANGSSRPDLMRLSARGTRVTPTKGARSAFHVDAARVLAVRDGRAFYALDTGDGRCFGVGSAETVGDPGGEICPEETFPSGRRPTLDFSVYEGSIADRNHMTLFRIEGFAADGVAAVGVVNAAGHVALRVPVVDNVYVVSHVPPGLTGAIVALDANGGVISGTDH